MNQTVAKTFGGIFILIGVVGFFSGGMTMTAGKELGLFPVNIVHNVVHILIGFWGLNASRSLAGATTYCKQAGILYLALGVLGLIPSVVDGLASVMPIGGYDHLLHFVVGGVLSFFGFIGGSEQAA